MLTACVLTQSVGGLFIGLPSAAIVVLLLAYGRRAIPALVLVALIAIGAFLLGASQTDRFARALDFTQGTNFYRVRVMQSALNVIADRPLTGLGLDQFLYAFRDTYIYPDAWPEPNLSHPHNMLLDFWVRLGVGGVLVAVGFIGAAFYASVATVRATVSRPFWHWAALGIAGAFTDTLTHGMLDNSVFVVDLVYVFFGLFALCLAIGGLKFAQRVNDDVTFV
jgi:O-antigen ligase